MGDLPSIRSAILITTGLTSLADGLNPIYSFWHRRVGLHANKSRSIVSILGLIKEKSVKVTFLWKKKSRFDATSTGVKVETTKRIAWENGSINETRSTSGLPWPLVMYPRMHYSITSPSFFSGFFGAWNGAWLSILCTDSGVLPWVAEIVSWLNRRMMLLDCHNQVITQNDRELVLRDWKPTTGSLLSSKLEKMTNAANLCPALTVVPEEVYIFFDQW